MLKRIILFLIRIRLDLKKNEKFRFTNQKSNAVYWFTSYGVYKYWYGHTVPSNVSINWLLSDECEIEKVPDTN